MWLVGYRTILVAVLSATAGIAANHGFSYDPQLLADALIGAVGAVMVVMRTVTRTPLGKKEA